MKKEIQLAISLICSEFGCTYKKLRSRSRQQPLPDTRKAVTYFLAEYTILGEREIGKIVGRDHSSVYAQLKTAETLFSTNNVFFIHIQKLRPSVMKLLTNAHITHCPACGHKLKGHE